MLQKDYVFPILAAASRRSWKKYLNVWFWFCSPGPLDTLGNTLSSRSSGVVTLLRERGREGGGEEGNGERKGEREMGRERG